MSQTHWRQALERIPEVKTRRSRRREWRNLRRAQFATYAPGGITHAERTAVWRLRWPVMSGQAELMRAQRAKALRAAAGAP